jgi:NAD(P)-dependent dehydrogenase (short-subunit alcohol dehydrogenase family)
MTRLEGTVVVTGGTGALGSAVCAELLEAGARVVATWVVEQERDRAQEMLGEHAGFELVEAVLSSTEGAEGAVAAATASHPPLSGLVNLVGGFSSGPRLHEAPPDELPQMLELNLMTAVRMTRAVLPAMLAQGGGSVVCVGTKAALEPFPGGLAYAVSKAAVISFVKALAVEYRDEGIRANAILPSVIDTPANREAMPDSDHSKWVPPVQIARTVRFLCSPDSAATSGAAIPVYGRA